jgi:DNA-binding winged helix-turn-helix (wHTH) protein
VRKKLGDTGGSEDLIKTVRGSGYIFAAALENASR